MQQERANGGKPWFSCRVQTSDQLDLPGRSPDGRRRSASRRRAQRSRRASHRYERFECAGATVTRASSCRAGERSGRRLPRGSATIRSFARARRAPPRAADEVPRSASAGDDRETSALLRGAQSDAALRSRRGAAPGSDPIASAAWPWRQIPAKPQPAVQRRPVALEPELALQALPNACDGCTAILFEYRGAKVRPQCLTAAPPAARLQARARAAARCPAQRADEISPKEHRGKAVGDLSPPTMHAQALAQVVIRGAPRSSTCQGFLQVGREVP